MKKILSTAKSTSRVGLVLLFIASFTLTAHQAVAQKLKPGNGVGKVTLGMSMEDFKAVVGDPIEVGTYDDERSSYVSSGYDPDKEAPFFLGFDKVLEYDNSKLAEDVELPVFKAFFKDDKLVYLILTSYGYGKSAYEGVKMKKGIKFHTPKDKVESAFGEGFISSRTSDHEYQSDYFSMGVTIVIDENVVRAFHVFAPFTADQEAEFKKKF